MELHDIHSLRLAVADRREALSRSMGPTRGERHARRRIGRAVVALGVRIAGEQRSAPARRYA
ncbi:MAG TPA: hypothetical protein VLB86_06375 [Gaiellaceae bacterium]|nr:hypothetical protein [Gaiellaceae bacterium]